MEAEVAGSVWCFRANSRRVVRRKMAGGRVELELENGIYRPLSFRRQIRETTRSGGDMGQECVSVRRVCLKTVGAGVSSQPLNHGPADRAGFVNGMNCTMAGLVVSRE